MPDGLPQGTVTFLFSDIEGSTDLSRRHGAAYGDLRAEHRRLLREAFAAHGGREVDAEGDAFFVVFQRAIDAVAASVDAQRALATAGLVRVRMGVHTTEPYLHSDGYVGVGVSRAARICAAAHGGQIVLSQATAGVVEDHDIEDVRLRDLGEHYLKDIPRAQRLFQVEADGLPSEFPQLGARTTAGTIATLVAIDLAGWSRVMAELGDDAAAVAANAYHRIVGGAARANDGVELERAADCTLCVFSTPKDALVAVAAIRARLEDDDWIRGTDKPNVAGAVHTGRVTSLTGGQLGSPAHRVTKLCYVAEPGQVLVSHATHALLEGEMLEGLALHDLGERELPGLGSSRVYELVATSP
jgi:class 3 adenylate cyclase